MNMPGPTIRLVRPAWYVARVDPSVCDPAEKRVVHNLNEADGTDHEPCGGGTRGSNGACGKGSCMMELSQLVCGQIQPGLGFYLVVALQRICPVVSVWCIQRSLHA